MFLNSVNIMRFSFQLSYIWDFAGKRCTRNKKTIKTKVSALKMYIFITCTEEVFNRTCGNKIIGIISKIDRELLLIKLVRSPLDFFIIYF